MQHAQIFAFRNLNIINEREITARENMLSIYVSTHLSRTHILVLNQIKYSQRKLKN